MPKEPTLEKPESAEEAVRKEVEEKVTKKRPPERPLFGTFSGVFTPTLLTILGVIMYLREGWVVGNAGLLGAWLIIVLSFAITTFTALALASITTNIRIGAGGAFSIISQSLGLEVGGSVGIPLYISQALAVAMYIFGFRAGWLTVFPAHPPLLVDILAFALLFAIGYISAGLAFKVQYLILAIIIGSLVSVAVAAFSGSMNQSIQWWGNFPGSPEGGFEGIGFWAVFAVFFPASTGIMAGANMSGDLKNPRKSIPVGTLSAIGLSLVVYLLLAWWLAASAATDELVGNYTVLIERSAWAPVVLAGLLGATFSSALSSIVGAPRILQALAEHKIMPKSSWLAVRSSSGEPRNAMLFTGALVLAALMLRNLNAIAPLITMFFLITYAMINVVVFIEQSLRLVSFRPLFRIPRLVSFIGAAGCIIAMFIVNLIFGAAALLVVLLLHGYLVRKHLKAPYGDVRSGLFAALAEWAAKKMENLTGPREKTWKANLLIPIETADQASRIYRLIRDISHPKGFVRLLGLTGRRSYDDLTETLPAVADRFQDDGVFATWTVVQAATFSENVAAGLEALGGAFFRSNLIFMRLPDTPDRREEIKGVIRSAEQNRLGVLLYAGPEEIPYTGKAIHMIIEEPPEGWKLGTDLGKSDLALLIAYKLKQNWESDLVFTAALKKENAREEALDYLKSVAELTRIPNAERRAAPLGRENIESETPCVTVYSMTGDMDIGAIDSKVDGAGTPCLFALDSGFENAFA